MEAGSYFLLFSSRFLLPLSQFGVSIVDRVSAGDIKGLEQKKFSWASKLKVTSHGLIPHHMSPSHLILVIAPGPCSSPPVLFLLVLCHCSRSFVIALSPLSSLLVLCHHFRSFVISSGPLSLPLVLCHCSRSVVITALLTYNSILLPQATDIDIN